MKRISAIVLVILLCISIAGCDAHSGSGNTSLLLSPKLEYTPQTVHTAPTEAETTEPLEILVPYAEPTEPSEPSASEYESSVTPTAPNTEPTIDTENSQTDPAEDGNTSQATEPPIAAAPTEPVPPMESTPETEPVITAPVQTGTPPIEDPQPTEPDSPTEPTSAPETEPPQPADSYTYPFNIEQIRRDCIALGRSYGFTLDESLTPGNSSWSGAETASASTQGSRLKRFLNEMVMYYNPTYREDTGLPAVNITAFNIYCESTGSGNYRIYFLFLL